MKKFGKGMSLVLAAMLMLSVRTAKVSAEEVDNSNDTAVVAEENQEKVVKEEIKDQPIEYEIDTEYRDDLPKSYFKVKSPGKNGILRVTYEVTYIGDKAVDAKILHEERVSEPVNQVNIRGTKEETSKDVKETSEDIKETPEADNKEEDKVTEPTKKETPEVTESSKEDQAPSEDKTLAEAKVKAIKELKAAGKDTELFVRYINSAKTVEGVEALKFSILAEHKVEQPGVQPEENKELAEAKAKAIEELKKAGKDTELFVRQINAAKTVEGVEALKNAILSEVKAKPSEDDKVKPSNKEEGNKVKPSDKAKPSEAKHSETKPSKSTKDFSSTGMSVAGVLGGMTAVVSGVAAEFIRRKRK